jgi:hypothetical protein
MIAQRLYHLASRGCTHPSGGGPRFTFKGKSVDVKQVSRALGVRYVLEGSVRNAGNRVRITGQLIDTASSAHIWADRFEGALDDMRITGPSGGGGRRCDRAETALRRNRAHDA